MEIVSVGFRTDLAVLRLAGATVEDCGDHLVVRSPYNPSFYWGNFLLLDHVPGADQVDDWLERFVEALPYAQHRALGFDGCRGTVEDIAGLAEHGLSVEASTVMTATSVHPPARPNDQATYRPLMDDNDWTESLELGLACGDDQSSGHREFATRRTASNRALVTAGHAQWFGAFLDGRLVAQMGLVKAGRGLARFQLVETHPDHRRSGLAGTLVHRVSGYGFRELGARKLVMVADPDYPAIRIYRAVGFNDSESQLLAERAPVPRQLC